MPAPSKRLLLIGWDSADWKLIHPLVDRGHMPALESLVNAGVSGNLTTLEPQLSPMLWTSIATGKHAYHHGVHGFTEVDPVSGQIVPVSAASRRCKTVWQILGEAGFRTHVVSWFATQGERLSNGKMISNMFSHLPPSSAKLPPEEWPPPLRGTYWPDDLGKELDQLRVSPHEMDGDDVIRLFVPRAQDVDQTRDRNLWTLAKQLAASYSVHAAATHLMEADPDWNFMAVYYRAIDEICHCFMPYHPPRMEGVPERDFELYRHVVDAAYRAHDLMLRRLIQLAGPETTVVVISDHGFHSDHLRPKFTPRVPAGITVWHRPQGIFAASGPGLRKDALIYGARLLDVTPTVLACFDLPVGADMEGRVLREIFADPPALRTIPSWESSQGLSKYCGTLSERASRDLLDQFVSLGYIEDTAGNPSDAARTTLRENRWNLARAYMDGGKYEQALPLLEECCAALPERSDYALILGRCQLRLGLLDEAEITIEAVLETFGRTESAQMVRANVAIEKRDFSTALGHLENVRQKNPEEPQLLSPLAHTYVKLRRWSDADKVARRLVELDPHNVQAHLVLARVALHRGESERAAELALEAIGYQYGNARGHYLLGVALQQMGDQEGARSAFTTCLQLAPHSLPAYRLLAQTLRSLGQRDEADQCNLQRLTLGSRLEKAAAERLHRIRTDLAERARRRREEKHGDQTNESGEKMARAERSDSAAPASPGMDFVLVSGLPRSGTSLMMQLLHAGGMPVMTDGKRAADEDNPEGYWEWEPVKQLSRNPRILEQASGNVTKVISALLPHLPGRHRYKIIFMRRPVDEVVRSQWKMLERQGRAPRSEAEHLARTQACHVEEILARLRRSERVSVLEVDFTDLIANPRPWIQQLQAFLNDDRLVHSEVMEKVIRPDLYRHRSDTVSPCTRLTP